MVNLETRSALQPGEPAPDFTLPAIHREGTISLSDYRGKKPVLLALFRGLWCPFCRRAIAQLGAASEKLGGLGVETLGVVATTTDNARLYFRHRPTKLPLVADPELTTLQAYRVPKPAVTPELLEGMQAVRWTEPGQAPVPMMEAAMRIDREEGFTATATDQADLNRQWPQLKGQFLVDRAGIVRWVNIEGAREGLAGLGKFPTEEELLTAARALTG
jgi:peroxiredoxin